MPLYEFQCWGCNEITEALRRVGDYSPLQCRVCGGATEHIVSAPALGIWNDEKQFPNVSNLGDGSMSFPSKEAYERHLKANHLGESAIDGKIERPHGNKVIARYK